MRGILFALTAAFATFVVAAIAFAVIDLYLTGHGRGSPMRHALIASGAVQLSVADAIALALSAVVGIATFVGARRR